MLEVQMYKHWLIAICGLALYIAPTLSSPQAKEDSPSQAMRVVGTMRTLNTAEYAYKYANANHKFGGKEEIAEFLRTEGRDSPPLIDIANSTPYEIDTVTDADRTHYWITIEPGIDPTTNTRVCGPAAFSNHVGVIYTGKALGCEENK
jgi:hypothetical protein